MQMKDNMSDNQSPEIKTPLFTRRQFLKSAAALAFGGTMREPPPPEKTEFTDGEWWNIKQPIAEAIQFVKLRGEMAFNNQRLDTPVTDRGLRVVEGGQIDSVHPLRRRFPSYDLTEARRVMATPDPRLIMPQEIGVFAFPKLDWAYMTPTFVVPTEINLQTGQEEGRQPQAMDKAQIFLPEAHTVDLGGGILGEAWELITQEEHRGYGATVTWAVKRAMPIVETGINLTEQAERLGKTARYPTSVFYTTADNKYYNAFTWSPSGVIFIPVKVDLEFLPPLPPPLPRQMEV